VKLPDSAHTSRPWRIHEIAGDFDLVDVWALPTPGGPDDFPRLVELAGRLDPARSRSQVTRTLFAIRWRIGQLLRWDETPADAPTLRDRLPADLRDSTRGLAFEATPFTPVYLLDDEFAAEVANATVHGVLHLGWVPDGTGGHRGQMAVLVKRNGLLGAAYLAAIRPFRHAVVYPSLLRDFGRGWRSHAAA